MHKLAYNRAKGPGVLFEALFNPSLAVVTKFKCRTKCSPTIDDDDDDMVVCHM